MPKVKIVKQKISKESRKETEEEYSPKRPVLFEVILLLLLAIPFILLILNGNVQTSNSGNQSLTNSWQDVSPAFSKLTPTPFITSSPATGY